jgi:hypothetical protein
MGFVVYEERHFLVSCSVFYVLKRCFIVLKISFYTFILFEFILYLCCWCLISFLQLNKLDALISQIYFGMKFYMFRTVPLSIITSFSLYTQQWYMSYRFADCLWAGSEWNCSSFLEWNSTCFGQFLCPLSGVFHCTYSNDTKFHADPARKLPANLYDIYHCCVYNSRLRMMDRVTVRNM